MATSHPRIQRALTMFSLVFAGEAIFCLPFHISRYFRPTFVDVFDVTQTQLGDLGSIYGVVATVAYVFGGMLADRFAARRLLAAALLMTGVSGFHLVTIPTYPAMCGLFAFWGASTILPFWAALIRATREWGGHDKQGEAFGILDGGRGLLAAALATLAVLLFAIVLPADEELATLTQRKAALQSTIVMYTAACLAAAIFVWLFVPEPPMAATENDGSNSRRGHLLEVLKMPAVWLQAIIIGCAYCTYKGIDYYSQYAYDVWQWSEVQAAGLSAYSSWMRPLAAVGAGFAADRLSSSRVIAGCFLLTGAAYVAFLCSAPGQAVYWLLWANVLASCVGIFALRGIYFALLEESSVPREMTGTAVGVISFIGYTPEIFMPLLGGRLIDHWAGGPTGYRVLFGFLCAMSVVGCGATIALRRVHR